MLGTRRRLTEDLIQLHDARVGADVAHGLGLAGVILLFEDIVEGQGLLRHHSHDVDGWVVCLAIGVGEVGEDGG